MIRLLLIICSFLWLSPAWADPSPSILHREILSLHLGQEVTAHRFTRAHLRAEMPLNHLGLTVRHHNLRDGLPSDASMEPVRGILLWSEIDRMQKPQQFIDWLVRQVQSGRKLVLMGDWAFQKDEKGTPTPLNQINRLLNLLGLHSDSNWTEYTYKHRIVQQDRHFVPFEANPVQPLPSFHVVYASSPDVHVVLGVKRPKDRQTSVLMSLSPNGGFIALSHALKQGQKESQKQWIPNPFEFFREAFATDDLPKPDTTTLSGRRIYYSHIDGDGWNNLAVFKDEVGKQRYASEYILQRVIAPFPDLPVTVAPIAAELNPDWHGKRESRDIARKLFALPQVELGSHTYTHPFSWEFYRNYTPDKEAIFRREFGSLTAQFKRTWALLSGARSTVNDTDHPTIDLNDNYEVPRPYMDEPFSLDMEVSGAAKYIESLAPKGKKVTVLQWSGDTSPFEQAIAATEAAGLANINGGDSRLDAEFPSLAWVAPVGSLVGKQIQVYSSNSNENTYTDLWTGRFYGFRYLSRTVKNTETPLRVKPFNIYYHMYSGERRASINALLENIQLARSQKLVPIHTSTFAKIGKGFFTTRLKTLGKDRWQILDRGALQTIRFDHATFQAVDFTRSKGVIGQTHHQGSLYVELDATIAEPIVALTTQSRADRTPRADHPYLQNARWQVHGLRPSATGVQAQVFGFGAGETLWFVPRPGTYEAVLRDDAGMIVHRETATTDADLNLYFALPAEAYTPHSLTITRLHE